MKMPDSFPPVTTMLVPWKDAVLGWVRSDWPDLTVRQLALLLVVGLEPGEHSVGALAVRLGVPKPIISRILDRLGILGLVTRRTDPRDRRNVFAVATPRSADFLEDMAGILGATIID